MRREYQYVEEVTGRRYKKVPIHAPGIRNGATGGRWKGMMPPLGKHWQYTPDKLDEMDARGEIYWSPSGNPRRKIYFDKSNGIPVQDVWTGMRDAHNQNIRVTGYPTEKPPELLERIIAASSNEGDIVLDCFAGSGTTLAAAEKLGRRWVGMDNSMVAVETIIKRLTRGVERMGDFVSAQMEIEASDQGRLPIVVETTNVVGSTNGSLLIQAKGPITPLPNRIRGQIETHSRGRSELISNDSASNFLLQQTTAKPELSGFDLLVDPKQTPPLIP